MSIAPVDVPGSMEQATSGAANVGFKIQLCTVYLSEILIIKTTHLNTALG